jgi:hypothetical protein
MKAVYVAHCLGSGPDREDNRKSAARWCAWLATHFDIAPVADWIILSGEWAETPELREKGLSIDVAIIERVDEVWMVGPRLSPGMMIEARYAVDAGKPVRNLVGQEKDPAAIGAIIESSRWRP